MLALLRETRHAAKLTQTELAVKVAMSQSFVTKYERGETRLDLAQLRVLCHALGTSLLDFVSTYERRLARKRRKG
jgi:transcriptional regulator with XRE-family HTH domain